MNRSFLYVPLSAALALSAVTGSFAAVNSGTVSSLVSSLSSLPATAERNNLISQLQSLSGSCSGASSNACVLALQSVVAAAKTLGVSSVSADVASLVQETAANTPGVTSDPDYVTLSSNVDTLSPTTPTGATGGAGGGTGGGAGGSGPGGGSGGGNFGPQTDGAASAGVTG